ncbi:MAG TPA: ABC transporter ATP-binding protein [Mycobacteriales bacterium]|nr:ABC transporter ATP-binding protein [Mycobacteriales bacterium]
MRLEWLRLWSALLRLALRADRRRAVTVLLLAPLAGAAIGAPALTLKWTVDAVVRGDRGQAFAAAAALAGAVVAVSLLGTAATSVRLALQQQAGQALDRHLIELCTGIPGLDRHEDPAFQDRLEILHRNRDVLASAISSLLENLRTGARLVSMVVLLAGIDLRLLLLPLFALPTVLAAGAGQRLQRRCDEEIAAPSRLRGWLFTLGSTAGPAKELRVYNLADELTRRHDRLQQVVNDRDQSTAIRVAALEFAGWTVFCAGILGAVALVLHRAVHGTATAGDVVLLVTLATHVDSTVATAARAVQWLRRASWAGSHYRWLIGEAGPSGSVAGPAPEPGELVFDRVTFGYPGREQPVLREVSLRIPAGATVALVGANGAGKSTVVKLLCRLYEPTSGHIRLGGRDIRDFPLDAWRARITAAFQDFYRYELPLRDGVGIGDLSTMDDAGAVTRAIARAGATALVDSLPAGAATQLGRSYTDGQDLSAGQWQQLAVARAMMREHPLLTILDEPTASLDPAAEQALFERYAAAAADPTSITILVSHRFSTVRTADLIVVLDSGQVRQFGTHQQLLAEPGPYATLVALHTRGFATPEATEPAAEPAPPVRQ